MQPYKKFVTDIFLSGWIDILNNVKNFALIPILTKSLGLTEYGIWVQMKIFLPFLVPLAMLGMSHAIVRYLSGDTDRTKVGGEFSSIAIFTVCNGLFLCCILWFLSRPISALILHDKNLYYLIRLFGVLMVCEALSVLALSYFRSFREMKLYSAISFFEICLEFSGILFMVHAGYGFLGAALAMVAVRAFFVYVKFSRIYRHVDFAFAPAAALKKFISFSLPLLISAHLFYIVDSGDKYIVNYFLGLEQSAVYSLAYSLAYTVVLITAPVIYILHPAIAACCNSGKRDEARVYISYSYKFFIIVGIPYCLLLALFARDLVVLISTNDYVASARYMPFLLIAFLIFQVGVISEYINIVFNRTLFVLFLHAGLAVFNVVMNIVLVPRFHLMGAVITSAATYCAFCAINIAYSRQFLRFPLEPGRVAFVAAIAAGLAVGINSIPMPILGKLSLAVPVCAVAYVVALRATGIITRKEVDFVRSLMGRKQAAI